MKKKIVILIICLVLLIGGIFIITGLNKGGLEKISNKELLTKIENKESFILMVGQTTCSHCLEYRPRLEKILKEYNLVGYYIEFDLLNDSEKEEFNKYITFSSTPVTIFFDKGGEETTATRIVGARDNEYVIAKLKKNGYIK